MSGLLELKALENLLHNQSTTPDWDVYRISPVGASCTSFYVYFLTAMHASNLAQQKSSQTSCRDASTPVNLKVHARTYQKRPHPEPSQNVLCSYSSFFQHQSLTKIEEGSVQWSGKLSADPFWVTADPHQHTGQSGCAQPDYYDKNHYQMSCSQTTAAANNSLNTVR